MPLPNDITAPLRISDLAALLNRPPERILMFAQNRGFKARNLLSVLTVREAQQIAEDVRNEHYEVRAGNTILRRKKIGEDGQPVPVPTLRPPPPPPTPPVDEDKPKQKPKKKPGRQPKALTLPPDQKPLAADPEPPDDVHEPEMKESEPMPTKLVELTADLVASQASTTSMSTDEIGASLVQVYNILFVINQAEEAGKPCGEIVCTCEDDESEGDAQETAPIAAAPTIDPSASIQKDKVICLECGESFTMLNSKHLKAHGLTSRTYKQKHGMKLGTKLMAGDALKKRSKAAKERGTGKGLAEWRATRKAQKKG